jgi:hypothetical protein
MHPAMHVLRVFGLLSLLAYGFRSYLTNATGSRLGARGQTQHKQRKPKQTKTLVPRHTFLPPFG